MATVVRPLYLPHSLFSLSFWSPTPSVKLSCRVALSLLFSMCLTRVSFSCDLLLHNFHYPSSELAFSPCLTVPISLVYSLYIIITNFSYVNILALLDGHNLFVIIITKKRIIE